MVRSNLESKPSMIRFGAWTAEGTEAVRIQASPDALRLLDLVDEPENGTSRALLERTRFEDLARLHRAASLGGRGSFSGTLRILLRDGGERHLVARGMRDPKAPSDRSFGILLELGTTPE
jgi:hypothetical protein